MLRCLSVLGGFAVDAATGFVVLVILFLGLAPSSAFGQPPPPPPVVIQVDMGVEKVSGTPPLLDGYGTFTARANTSYQVLLLAAPVSGTNPTNEYAIVKRITVTTDGDGVGRVDASTLVGNAPLATSGWNVRIAVTGTGNDESETLTAPTYIPVSDD